MSRSNTAAAQAALVARVSESRALQLCREVEALEAQATPNVVKLGEDLRSLAEVLVYNDKHNELIADKVLMERDLMSTLERLATNAMLPVSVKTHVLQCVTVLLQNLTRVPSLYFLCSNNHINRMIAIPVDEDDDELAAMFVSFLKSLALRLNKDTVQFFFDADLQAFPLLDSAVNIMASTNDPMARAAARQIIVCVIQIDDATVRAFLRTALVEVYEGVLNNMVNHLANTARHIPCLTPGSGLRAGTLNMRAVNILMEDVVDDVLYINDLYRSAPEATDSDQLLALVERIVLAPVRELLEAELAGTPVPLHLHAHTMCTVPPSVAVGFLARWVRENEVAELHDAFCRALVTAAPTGAHDNVVGAPSSGSRALLDRLLCSAPLLLPGVLLLRRSLRGSVPSASEDELRTDTDPSASQAAPTTLAGRIAVLTSAAHRRATVPAESLACLLTTLDAHLTGSTPYGEGGGVALSAVALLLRELTAALTAAGRRVFAAVMRRVCRATLRARVAAQERRLRRGVDGGAETGDDSEAAAWHRRHRFVTALGLHDAHLVEMLELLHSCPPGSPSAALGALLSTCEEVGVAPLLPPRADLKLDDSDRAHWDGNATARYDALLEEVRDSIPLSQRAAVTGAEKDRVLRLVMLLVEYVAREELQGPMEAANAKSRSQHVQGHPEAGDRPMSLLDALESMHAWYRPLTHVPPDCGIGATPAPLRCELVSFYSASGVEGKRAVCPVRPGAAVHLAVTPTHALLIEPPHAVSALGEKARGEGLVRLALDLLYVRAALLPAGAPYRVVVQGLYPCKEMEIELVFRDAERAAEALTRLNTCSSRARLEASRFLRDYLSDGEAER